jgi:hypothetical protein
MPRAAQKKNIYYDQSAVNVSTASIRSLPLRTILLWWHCAILPIISLLIGPSMEQKRHSHEAKFPQLIPIMSLFRGWGLFFALASVTILNLCRQFSPIYAPKPNRHFVFVLLRPFSLILIWAITTRAFGPFRGIFPLLQVNLSNCVIDNHMHSQVPRAAKLCREAGGYWNDFDVSSHSFLFTSIVMMFFEEIRDFWRSIDRFPTSRTFSDYFVYILVLVQILYAAFCLVSNIFTLLFHHTFTEGLIGTFCGLVHWGIFYRLL